MSSVVNSFFAISISWLINCLIAEMLNKSFPSLVFASIFSVLDIIFGILLLTYVFIAPILAVSSSLVLLFVIVLCILTCPKVSSSAILLACFNSSNNATASIAGSKLITTSPVKIKSTIPNSSKWSISSTNVTKSAWISDLVNTLFTNDKSSLAILPPTLAAYSTKSTRWTPNKSLSAATNNKLWTLLITLSL